MSANSDDRKTQAKPVGSSKKGQGSLTEPPITSTTNRFERPLNAAAASRAMPKGTHVAGTASNLQQAGQTASPSARPQGMLVGGTAPSLQHGPTHSGQILTDSHSPNHLPSQGGVVSAHQDSLEPLEVQQWRAMGYPNCPICGKRHPPPHKEEITQQALAKAAKKQKSKERRIAAHAAKQRKNGSKPSLMNKKRDTAESPPPAASGTYGARTWPALATSQATSPAQGATHPPQFEAHSPQPPQPNVQGAAISDQWMELIPQMFALLPLEHQMRFMAAVFSGTTHQLMHSPIGSNIIQVINTNTANATGSGSQTTSRLETTSEQLGNAYTSEGHRSEDMKGKQPQRE